MYISKYSPWLIEICAKSAPALPQTKDIDSRFIGNPKLGVNVIWL